LYLLNNQKSILMDYSIKFIMIFIFNHTNCYIINNKELMKIELYLMHNIKHKNYLSFVN